MFYTYILYSPSKDKYYIGATENPEERIKKHNNKNKGFTNQSSDWEIVLLKAFDDKKEALAFEKTIKSWKSQCENSICLLNIQKLFRSYWASYKIS